MKIKFTFHPANDTWLWPLNKENFQASLKNHGVQVVKGGQDFDFMDVAIANVTKFTKPTILFDRTDTSIVTPWGYAHHDKPLTLGYVVPTLHTDWKQAVAYRNTWKGCRQPKKPVVHLNTTLWHRWKVHFPHMSREFNKDYRASFLGRTAYPNTIFPEVHRREMLKSWHRIQGLTLGVFSALPTRPFSQELNWKVISSSKVVVSPWGLTELCWRDYHACLGRCMIVKPRQAEIQTYVTPWRDTNTIWCEPDFSDLPEAVDEAEAAWDYDSLEDIRLEMVREATRQDSLAERVATTLKSFDDTL